MFEVGVSMKHIPKGTVGIPTVKVDKTIQEVRIFDTFTVHHDRAYDSEVKILETIGQRLGGKKGQIFPNVKGEINLISEPPFCDSSSGVVDQFRTMFPNVKVNMQYLGTRVPKKW